MVLVGSWSAAGRRTFFTLGLAAAVLMAPSSVAAQGAAGQAPPAQQDAFNFSAHDAGMIVWTVPEAQVADFESVWGTILAKLNASDTPELKELGGLLSVVRPATPAPGQPVQYFIVANPAPKTTVSPTFLLYESKLFSREEAEALFKKLPTSSPISALPLKKVQPGAATSAPAATPPSAPSTTPPAATTPPATQP
jgi:hypothetical protein